MTNPPAGNFERMFTHSDPPEKKRADIERYVTRQIRDALEQLACEFGRPGDTTLMPKLMLQAAPIIKEVTDEHVLLFVD